MTCSRSPQLTDIDLLMVLDGQADPEAAEHFEHCPDCRQRAARLQEMQNRLAQRLFRATCPPSMDLGDFHLGLLPAARAREVEKHLATCRWCSSEQAILGNFLAEPLPAARLDLVTPIRQSVRVLVARLSGLLPEGGGLGQPNLAPALAGLRGVAEGPLMYEAEGMQVMTEVLDDATHPGRKALVGLLTGVYPFASFHAYLWRAATYWSSTPISDLGNFTIDNLVPGDYSLVLSGPELEIHIDDVPVLAS